MTNYYASQVRSLKFIITFVPKEKNPIFRYFLGGGGGELKILKKMARHLWPVPQTLDKFMISAAFSGSNYIFKKINSQLSFYFHTLYKILAKKTIVCQKFDCVLFFNHTFES